MIEYVDFESIEPFYIHLYAIKSLNIQYSESNKSPSVGEATLTSVLGRHTGSVTNVSKLSELAPGYYAAGDSAMHPLPDSGALVSRTSLKSVRPGRHGQASHDARTRSSLGSLHASGAGTPRSRLAHAPSGTKVTPVTPQPLPSPLRPAPTPPTAPVPVGPGPAGRPSEAVAHSVSAPALSSGPSRRDSPLEQARSWAGRDQGKAAAAAAPVSGRARRARGGLLWCCFAPAAPTTEDPSAHVDAQHVFLRQA